MADYSSFLPSTPDGLIWWPVRIAIKLCAGYEPSSDGSLKAHSATQRAHELEILAGLNRDAPLVPAPRWVEQQGETYVEAASLLMWMGASEAAGTVIAPFPVQLARAVAEVSRGGRKVETFSSLSEALEGKFDTPWPDLPLDLRARVEASFGPFSWEWLDSKGRQSIAAQWDQQHDPANEGANEYWFKHGFRAVELRRELAKFGNAKPHSAEEAQRRAIERELEDLDRVAQRTVALKGVSARKSVPTGSLVPFPRAMALLADRVSTTVEELGAWVFYGQLSAFVKRGGDPVRFQFDPFTHRNDDYKALLAKCWFVATEVRAFKPTDRFTTGKALIEEWTPRLQVPAGAFIQAKVEEHRLTDLHPIFGETRASKPEAELPPLEEALFESAQIDAIEREDFPGEGEPEDRGEPTCSAEDIRRAFLVIRGDVAQSDKWWTRKMRDAKQNGLDACRWGGGSKARGQTRWKPGRVAEWLTERADKLGLTNRSIAAALSRIPGAEACAREYRERNGLEVP